MNELTVDIDFLGAQGDGIAQTDNGPLYVAYALPGETVDVAPQEAERAALKRIVTPSPHRVKPPCRHFGQCGGCSIQHLDGESYRGWKRSLVETALAHRGIETDIEPLIGAQPRSRRRATFAAMRTKKAVTLGYYARGTHNIVGVEECPLVVPEIEGALAGLSALVAPGLSRKGRAAIAVTATRSGLDVSVTGAKALDDAEDSGLRAKLAQGADGMDLARLSWEGEIVAERRPPMIRLGSLDISLPPGGFLQATEDGEAALSSRVAETVGEARHVVDLFAGAGTFAASLAENAAVHAVENDTEALKRLERAVRDQGPGLKLKPLTTERRDLFRRPLLASELDKYDAVVLDPPRAGAQAQAAELAKSRVPRIAFVSCSPASFARDARMLVDGGYRLVSVTPVDQFLWSAHVELIGVFVRG